MTRYSVQPRNRIFVKGYVFLSFAKNISKSLSGKYSQKLIGHAKQSATDVFKTPSKRAIKKTADATGDFIGNQSNDGKIMGVSKNSQQNNSETVYKLE